jgi:nucleoside-diphosphate-sugar epimerase
MNKGGAIPLTKLKTSRFLRVNSMKLLVMGAGYVGMALLSHLQHQNHEVFITTTDEKKVETLKAYGNDVLVLNPHQEHLFQEWIDRSDAIIVMIAPKNSQNYKASYLDTAQKISQALEHRKRPLHLIYTSSTSVYEGLTNESVTEDLSLHPSSENPNILLETEKCYMGAKAKSCILRLGGIYGPERTLENRTRYISGKEMDGTGEELTNHIHQEDIVRAILFCLENSLTGIYNLVNDEHPKRKTLYSDLCHAMNIPPPTWSLISSKKSGYLVSNQKIKDAGFIFFQPTFIIQNHITTPINIKI